jgi:formylglycine-generating enzyme required for sulfatase activity
MLEENIQLTVVQLDLFQSSKSTKFIEDQLGIQGTKLFVEQIRKFVEDAFNPIRITSIYNETYSLGGDGYRILFKDVDDAYKFVKYFCIKVDKYNITKDNKRLFRIGAATGNVLYDESQSGIDRIIGHRVLFTVSRMVTAADPGWLYIDKATYKALPQESQKNFILRNIEGKKHENNFDVYACPMLCDASPFMQPFNFEIAIIDKENKVSYKSKETKEVQIEAKYFIEKLDNNVNLEMISIPGGIFQMGTTEDEIERLCKLYNEDYFKQEGEQHGVTVQSFCFGRYPVTQAQWKAVASFPQINRELNPNPSYFQGANLPVECVSWDDAEEFCSRLSHHTKKQYRLPSEAEWEYACRAGTKTAFHFGETLKTDLANYNGEYGGEGDYRKETTEVGSMKFANRFGLYDMHGNVWEWCQDHWHNSYEGAPTDESAWINTSHNTKGRILRGGSWCTGLANCRSMRRLYANSGQEHNTYGFRVACSSSWIL